jgi:hypothetical protein
VGLLIDGCNDFLLAFPVRYWTFFPENRIAPESMGNPERIAQTVPSSEKEERV